MKTGKKLIAVVIVMSIIATMHPFTASANRSEAWGAANVDGSGVRIRSGPGLTYDVLTHVNRGDIVVVLERTNDEWFRINFHGTVGYVNVPFLDNSRRAANFNAAGRITGNHVNMREKPDVNGNILSTHNQGTTMNIIGINEGWYKVVYGDQTGYVRSDLMNILSRAEAASASASGSAGTNTVPNPGHSLGQQIADYALGFLGTPYVWGGTSPSGFDCSGLVTYATRQFGISVTRTASGQYKDNGVSVNKSDLIPGDLVFFSNNGGRSVTHVGIYIGDGKFVHASGTRVGVIISSLNSAYYTKAWYGAKRVI